MRTVVYLTLITLVLPVSVRARLDETERELIARFGSPITRSKTVTTLQGRTYQLGPRLAFRQNDWFIDCDLIDGRCARISYSKVGNWTDDQILTVLTINAQGAKWTDVSNSHLRNLSRDWKREDGATAHWQQGISLSITTPSFERAKQIAEAKAKAESGQIPKL